VRAAWPGRPSALLACEAAADGQAAKETGQTASIRVTDEHMTAALDQLPDTKNQLTRVLLGAQPGEALPGGAPHGQAPWPVVPGQA